LHVPSGVFEYDDYRNGQPAPGAAVGGDGGDYPCQCASDLFSSSSSLAGGGVEIPADLFGWNCSGLAGQFFYSHCGGRLPVGRQDDGVKRSSASGRASQSAVA